MAERSARSPNEHFDENSELVETQGSVLDLADRSGLPAAATDGPDRHGKGSRSELGLLPGEGCCKRVCPQRHGLDRSRGEEPLSHLENVKEFTR